MRLISCCVFWNRKKHSLGKSFTESPQLCQSWCSQLGPGCGEPGESLQRDQCGVGHELRHCLVGHRQQVLRLLVQCFGCYLKKLICSDIYAVSILETISCLSDALKEDFFLLSLRIWLALWSRDFLKVLQMEKSGTLVSHWSSMKNGKRFSIFNLRCVLKTLWNKSVVEVRGRSLGSQHEVQLQYFLRLTFNRWRNERHESVFEGWSWQICS